MTQQRAASSTGVKEAACKGAAGAALAALALPRDAATWAASGANCKDVCVCVFHSSVQFYGYEVSTEGDAFLVAFHEPFDAVAWCLCVQLALHCKSTECGGSAAVRLSGAAHHYSACLLAFVPEPPLVPYHIALNRQHTMKAAIL